MPNEQVIPLFWNGTAYVTFSSTNPLPISGTITSTEASVGATGAAVPASANYLGISIGGNLTGVLGGHGTAAGALRVELPTDGTGIVGISQATPGTTNAVALAQVGATTLATPELTGRVPTSEPDALLIASASVTSAATIFTQDTTGYASIDIQFTAVGSGNTVTFEHSDDNSNWVSVAVQIRGATGGNPPATAIAVSTTNTYAGPLTARYFRARVSTYGSGTMTALAYLRKVSFNFLTTSIQGTVGSAATDSGNPVKIGGVYNSTLPTFTTGQRGDLQIGTRGALNATLWAQDSGAAIGSVTTPADTTTNASLSLLRTGAFGYVYNGASWDLLRGSTAGILMQPQAIATGGASFLNIAAGQATTVVKSGAGTLYAIVLNSAATAANTTTIYDNTAASGTVIGRPAVTTATVPTTLTFGPAGLAFATGLTIITATQNGGDMTVIYK